MYPSAWPKCISLLQGLQEQQWRLKMLAKVGRERKPTQSVETEMTNTKKLAQEIKSMMNEKCVLDNFLPPPAKPLNRHEEPKSTAPIEELNEMRIGGILKRKEKGARERRKHSLTEVEKVLLHLELETTFTDIVRLEESDEKKTHTNPLKNPNPWQRRIFLSSANKLKIFDRTVFVSRELCKMEAELENKDLIRRRELFNRGVEPKNIRVRDGGLFIRNENK